MDIRKVKKLIELLDESGIAEIEITEGEEAVRHARLHRPDVVLLDLGLPDSQGLDTFLTLRAEVPEVAVVVVTGLDDGAVVADEHLVRIAFELGGRDLGQLAELRHAEDLEAIADDPEMQARFRLERHFVDLVKPLRDG